MKKVACREKEREGERKREMEGEREREKRAACKWKNADRQTTTHISN
jgi:hypothetical protein